MPSAHLLWPFFVATLVFAVIPGPAILYTAAQTVARGRQGGFMAALGIHVGGYTYVVATALGLAALLSYVPTVYAAVKLAGAGYLIWLGISMIRSKLDPGETPHVARKSARRAFLESVTVEILNPKAAVFYIAFLPQFTHPAAVLPVTAQFLILGTIVNLMFSSADIVTVLLASRVVHILARRSIGQHVAQVVGGSVLIALGTRLALDNSR